MALKDLVGKKMSKAVKFMGEDVKIYKLSVSEVLRIQEQAKLIEKDETKGLDVLKTVIRFGVEGGDKLEDDDFEGFPMEELSKLSNSIMEYSGIGNQPGK